MSALINKLDARKVLNVGECVADDLQDQALPDLVQSLIIPQALDPNLEVEGSSVGLIFPSWLNTCLKHTDCGNSLLRSSYLITIQ